MPACRNCGATLEDSYRFCPMCATPQTEEASRRLEAYVETRAEATGTGSTPLETRVSYAVGFLALVAGFATLLDLGGAFFLLAGLFVLPPVQGLIEDRLDQSFDPAPTFGVAGVLVALGVAVILLL